MPSGDTERRPRTSPARERAAERGRTPRGSALARQARLADASHASRDGGPAAARALLSWRARAAAQTLPGRCPAPSSGGLRTGTGTPSWENSWGPAHTLLRPSAERPGALTGTQGPRYAGSRGNCSLLGFDLNVTPETMQRPQESIGSMLFDISLSSLVSSTTSDWAMQTKHKRNKWGLRQSKRNLLHGKGNPPQNQNTT